MSLEHSPSQAVQQLTAAASAGNMPPPAGHTTAEATEQPYFRFDILRALELHRKLALSFAVTGMALAVAYAALSWPVYTAESEIYIQPTSVKIMDQGNNQTRWPYDSNTYDSFIQQQVQLASNPDVLEDAMRKLPAGSWQKAGESDQAAAERLGRSIKVEREGSSYQVGITAQSKSAEMAAQIANAVAGSIVEKAAHEENAGDPQRLAILKSERDRVQNQLNADLAEQDTLNKQLGMAAVGTEAPDLIDNAIGATREELIKARTDHDQAEARFASLDAKNPQSSAALDAEADELVAGDPGLTSMKTSLNQRRATLITQMANLTPNNPEYKLDAQELAQINTSLDAMMKDLRVKAAARIREKLRTDLERTAGVEARLNGQLRQLAETAASATPKLQRDNDLATDIVRLRSRYAAVDEELHDIILQDSVPGAVHLAVTAAPPLDPSYTGILRRSLPLGVGGILLGLLAALLANQLDPKVYIGSDVQHLLGFAPLIALPDYGEVPEAVFEEHILRLSTAIEHARQQGSLRNCIFTGTGPGTGVTAVVTRVRDMLASMGRPTVLVDAADGLRAATPRSGEGIRFEGSAQTAQTAANERGSRSLALLQRVTAETGTQDESLVLSDTAPLLISAETEYLARFVDCAIVVAESGVTTRAELRATAAALQRLSVPAAGLVLNRVSLAKADAAFRKSVLGVAAHVREQGRTTARQVPRSAPRRRDFEADVPTAPVKHETRKRVAEPEAPARPPAVTYSQAVAHRQPMESKVSAMVLPQPAAERLAMERGAEAEAPPAASQFPPQFMSQEDTVSALAGSPAPSPRNGRGTQESAAPGPAPDANVPWWLSETPLTTQATNGKILSDGSPGARERASQPGGRGAVGFPVSRLSGLRNVLFGVGALGTVKRDGERREEPWNEEPAQPPVRSKSFEPEPLVAPEFEPEELGPEAHAIELFAGQPYRPEPYVPESSAPVLAPAYASPYTPIPEPAPRPAAAAETGEPQGTLRVVAAPEFLPPQTARLDRRDTLDDIEVLPSRRGQYCRKG